MCVPEMIHLQFYIIRFNETRLLNKWMPKFIFIGLHIHSLQ